MQGEAKQIDSLRRFTLVIVDVFLFGSYSLSEDVIKLN